MTSPIAGAIGGNLLRDFRVEIDYRRGVTYLERKTTTADHDLTAVGLVVGMALNGDCGVTGISSAAGPKTKELIQPGDRLMSIDGHEVSSMPIGVIAGLLSGNPGDTKNLVLRRKRTNIEVKVPVVKLL